VTEGVDAVLVDISEGVPDHEQRAELIRWGAEYLGNTVGEDDAIRIGRLAIFYRDTVIRNAKRRGQRLNFDQAAMLGLGLLVGTRASARPGDPARNDRGADRSARPDSGEFATPCSKFRNRSAEASESGDTRAQGEEDPPARTRGLVRPLYACRDRLRWSLRERERQAAHASSEGTRLHMPGPPEADPSANGAPEEGWDALRLALRDKIQALGTNYRAVSAAAGCKQGTLRSWLSTRPSTPPSTRSQAKLRDWLAAVSASPQIAEDLPSWELTNAEKNTLAGHLAIGASSLELRETFGCTRELLDQAVAGGQHLNPDIIRRVRGALKNGSAEAI
jgi:hypothetical protein